MVKEQILLTAQVIGNLKLAIYYYESLFVGDESTESYKVFSSVPDLASMLRQSLGDKIIQNAASAFCDPKKSFGNENMSLSNIRDKLIKYECIVASTIYGDIESKVECSGIKNYRNKYLSHFDLSHVLGQQAIDGKITTRALNELFDLGIRYLDIIRNNSDLCISDGEWHSYSNINPESDPQEFIKRFKL